MDHITKALVVKDLNKSYGKHHVLKNISFHIDEGEIVGFVGPNGSGKSTTMKCITNLVIPDSGEIEIFGHSLKKQLKKALSQVSAQIEYPGLYNNLSGLDNLKYFSLLRNTPKAKLDEIIRFINIGDSIKRTAGTYSMGMKQRLSLGIALLSDPKLLILDEPTNGLDPSAVFELRELLLSLKERGISLLFSSHTLSEIDRIADRTIFIDNGTFIDVPISMLNDNIYEIKVSDLVKASELLQQLPLKSEVNLSNNSMVIHVQHQNELQKIITFLNNLQIQIYDISKISVGVEAVYESIFGGTK